MACPVFINTIPKSGTHLLQKLLQMAGYTAMPGIVMNARRGDWSEDRSSVAQLMAADGRLLEPAGKAAVGDSWVGYLETADFDEQIGSQTFSRMHANDLLAGHLLHTERAERCFTRSDARMIVVWRDPRAAAASHAAWVMRDDAVHPLRQMYAGLSPSDRLMASLEGFDLPAGSEVGHLPLLWRYRNMCRWVAAGALAVRFEDLVGWQGGGSDARQVATIRRILRYVGLQDDVEGVERLRSGLFGGTATFRAGQARGWECIGREWETPARRQAIAEMMWIMRDAVSQTPIVPPPEPEKGSTADPGGNDAPEPSSQEWKQLAEATQADHARLQLELSQSQEREKALRGQITFLRRGWGVTDRQELTQGGASEPIFFNTLPKSGSVYLVQTLARGLSRPLRSTSNGYFPHDLIDLARLRAVAAEGAICQEHIDAHPLNLRFLEQWCPRFILHVRDPRAAMLSWVHHLGRLIREEQGDLLTAASPMPANFSALSLEARLDWAVAEYLPQCVAWIEGWVEAAAQRPGLQVLWSTYESFVADEAGFVNRVLDFYNIDRGEFESCSIEKTMQTNYRSGRVDEWRDAMSPDQQQAAKDVIPKSLAERFGWSLNG